MLHLVYWIHLKDETNCYEDGYVGVSGNINRRLYQHWNGKGSVVVFNKLQKYYDNVIVEFLFQGEEEDCYDFESKLRPHKNIGWNIAEGGNKPPTNQGGEERAQKLRAKLKNVPLSEEHKRKISLGHLGKRKTKTHVENIQKSKKINGTNTPWNKGIKTGPQSEETREKRKSSLKGKNAKSITTPLGEFKSLRAAAKAHNVTPGTIINRSRTNASEYFYTNE